MAWQVFDHWQARETSPATTPSARPVSWELLHGTIHFVRHGLVTHYFQGTLVRFEIKDPSQLAFFK